MNRIVISIACLAVISCGCNQTPTQTPTDNSKIDALSQKLDVVLQNQSLIISNQVAILNEVEAVKSSATNEINLTKGIFADTGNIIELEGLNTKAIEAKIDGQAH